MRSFDCIVGSTDLVHIIIRIEIVVKVIKVICDGVSFVQLIHYIIPWV